MYCIGDKVVVISKEKRIVSHGIIIDMKWNLTLVELENGECEWIDSRLIKHPGLL